MFLWDNTGETRIRFDPADQGGARGAPAIECAGAGLAAWLDACTVPIVVHDHARAGILGTATLLRVGQRHLLLTAAHLFDGATTSGNWLIPERTSGHLLPLEGAQVRIIQGSDMALIDLARAAARLRLLRGRAAIPAHLALRARPAVRPRRQRAATGIATYCVAGYPAAWSRFERGYLAAKRLTITTTRITIDTSTRTAPIPAKSSTAQQPDDSTSELHCRYGRIAERSDGQVIHTPALEGMSGAAIWEVTHGTCGNGGNGSNGSNGAATLHLAGVQSAFMHSRYLRGAAAGSCEQFFCR